MYPAAWIGQALLAYALFETPEPLRKKYLSGALTGWIFGTSVNVIVLRFVPETIARFTDLPRAVGLLALLLLAMFQGVRWLVAGWLTVQLIRRRVPSFLAFGIAVWLSTFVPGVFGWTVASGISPMTSLVQVADVIGERGVSALLAISSALLAEGLRNAVEQDFSSGEWGRSSHTRGLRKRSLHYASIGVAIPAVMMISGVLRMRSIEAARSGAPKARVTLVQPSTEARMRWDPNEADSIVRRLTMLTIGAEQRGTDLVVWPEAAFPYAISSRAKTDAFGTHAILQAGVRGPVLAGVLMSGREAEYNSAVMVHGGRIDAPYHKMHLLAFGESVPFSGTFPVLRRIFARGTGMAPGDHQVLLSAGAIHAAVLNCFEDTLPEAGVEAADVDPNLLVNITNDAWFVETRESELHLRLATMRAIELRKDFVRAVNFGPTSWIDATGRVRGRYDETSPGTLPTTPALLEGKTLFARLGDFSGALLLALLSCATWLGTLKRKRRVSREDTPNPES